MKLWRNSRDHRFSGVGAHTKCVESRRGAARPGKLERPTEAGSGARVERQATVLKPQVGGTDIVEFTGSLDATASPLRSRRGQQGEHILCEKQAAFWAECTTAGGY